MGISDICLSVYLDICLSIHPFIHPSIYRHIDSGVWFPYSGSFPSTFLAQLYNTFLASPQKKRPKRTRSFGCKRKRGFENFEALGFQELLKLWASKSEAVTGM